MFDTIVSNPHRLGSEIGMTECEQARFVNSLGRPFPHLFIVERELRHVGHVRLAFQPFLHARANLLPRHRRIDETAEICSTGPKQTRRAEVRRLGILPVGFSHGRSAPERHGAGDAEIEKQFSKERLIVDVRVEQSRDDEFSGEVHNGGAGGNCGRPSAEGGDLVCFDHNHGVRNSPSRHDVDGRCTPQHHAIDGKRLLRKNDAAEYGAKQRRKSENVSGFIHSFL